RAGERVDVLLDHQGSAGRAAQGPTGPGLHPEEVAAELRIERVTDVRHREPPVQIEQALIEAVAAGEIHPELVAAEAGPVRDIQRRAESPSPQRGTHAAAHVLRARSARLVHLARDAEIAVDV